MPPVGRIVRDGDLRQLEPMRCTGCGRMLLRMDPEALKPGKILELKCRCDFMNYRIGKTT